MTYYVGRRHDDTCCLLLLGRWDDAGTLGHITKKRIVLYYCC